MDIPNLQRLMMVSSDTFYSQNDISECFEVLKKEKNISSIELMNTLMEYNKEHHAIDFSDKIQKYLYLLKHEKHIPLGVTNDLFKVGLQKKTINIVNKDVYTYAYYDMSRGDYEKLSPVEQLERVGVVTTQVIPKEHLKMFQKRFDETLLNFPEYKRGEDPSLDINGNPLIYVAGGFAALGNPASFHNEMSRDLRMKAYQKIKDLMSQYVNRLGYTDQIKKNVHLQALSDRIMYRLKGQSGPSEAWHRDVMPPSKINYDDEIFGGWINLDSQDQYFSCIPGSHTDTVQYTLDSGFSALTKVVTKIYVKNGKPAPSEKELKVYVNEVAKNKYKFKVPPGHMIIFPQYLLHEVISTPAKYNMRRQFTGWRITSSNTPLYPLELFDEQAVIPLPGGMVPPIYASNHISRFQNKRFQGSMYGLLEWSEVTFQDKILQKYKPPRSDEYRKIVPRYMKSLTSYGFPLYPPYQEEERSIYLGEKI